MDDKQWTSHTAALLVAVFVLPLAFATPAQAFDPVSYESGTNTISLHFTGTVRGGFFSRNTPASPPGYDRYSKRLFVGSVDRQGVDVISISDPYSPQRLFTIDITPFGSEPNSVAVHQGIVAVSVKTEGEPARSSQILFYNAGGLLIGGPIEIDGAGRVAFTPNGRKLVATIPGTPSEDCQDPEGAIAVIDLGPVNWGGCRRDPGKCHIQPTVRRAGFSRFNQKKNDLIAGGARFYGPDPEITVAQDVNPEGLSISADSRFAWVTLERNNAIAKVDLQDAKVTDIHPLGSKDHSLTGNAFDASDRDGPSAGPRINIQHWPVLSFYSPDGIAVIGAGRRTYLVTADEGDPKDDACYSERRRVGDTGDTGFPLDPTRFPDASTLKLNTNLGRLGVTNANGDIDGDGDFDQIYMLGSRSFSVWRPDGGKVFNSGDEFEQITAKALPLNFNAAEDENTLDARSDERGPEPEHLAVGRVGGREYLFVGFERISGLVAYDITDPTKPLFQQYINNRNFALEPRAPGVCTPDGEKGQPELPTCAEVGDLEPEGFVFITKEESPIDVPLLAVIHELSDSTTLYRIDEVERGE